MNINDLIAIVKKKLKANIAMERINIEDKSFLHKNHSGHQDGHYHLKLIISSIELKNLGKIERSKKIHKILDQELKDHIHSLQILIS
jgi:BolA family transcriptional regulator, general stress-responsive regulator|tara:strand:- start:5559 stop:5819 length:261 start_codon:yes stop_codon:yes gene_type:complete